jgi:hypothetical protein
LLSRLDVVFSPLFSQALHMPADVAKKRLLHAVLAHYVACINCSLGMRIRHEVLRPDDETNNTHVLNRLLRCKNHSWTQVVTLLGHDWFLSILVLLVNHESVTARSKGQMSVYQGPCKMPLGISCSSHWCCSVELSDNHDDFWLLGRSFVSPSFSAAWSLVITP